MVRHTRERPQHTTFSLAARLFLSGRKSHKRLMNDLKCLFWALHREYIHTKNQLLLQIRRKIIKPSNELHFGLFDAI